MNAYNLLYVKFKNRKSDSALHARAASVHLCNYVSTNKQSEAMLFLFWLHCKSVLHNLQVTVPKDTQNKKNSSDFLCSLCFAVKINLKKYLWGLYFK